MTLRTGRQGGRRMHAHTGMGGGFAGDWRRWHTCGEVAEGDVYWLGGWRWGEGEGERFREPS